MVKDRMSKLIRAFDNSSILDPLQPAKEMEGWRALPIQECGEELVPLGERPYIPFSIARFYARSVMTWDVQNQVWAFDALIRHLPE